MGHRYIEIVKILGLDLVGVIDSSPESLAKIQNEFDLDQNILFQVPDHLYKSKIVDCVIVATTADSHCQLVIDAAGAGVSYILVEKPMAVSLGECKLMIDVCEKNNVRLSVNHQMRFLEQYILPKTMLATAEFGGLKSMTVLAGNFGLAMNGLHYIEAFRFLSEDRPASISAWFSEGKVPNPRGPQFEDKAGCIRLVTKNGIRLYIDASIDQGNGVVVTYVARNGVIQVNELNGSLTCFARTVEHRDEPTVRYGLPSNHQSMDIPAVELIDSTAKVLNALISGVDYVSAQDGMSAIEVLEAAYRSSELSGATLSLRDEKNLSRKFAWA